jgi:hypothetical protein
MAWGLHPWRWNHENEKNKARKSKHIKSKLQFYLSATKSCISAIFAVWLRSILSLFILYVFFLRNRARIWDRSKFYQHRTQKRHKNVHFTPSINKLVNGFVWCRGLFEGFPSVAFKYSAQDFFQRSSDDNGSL